MSASWQAYEGQFINNTFPLQRYLGGSEHSAVFLTRVAGPQSAKAAIKLVPARASATLRLALWDRVSRLSHPNLLGLFQSGRCRLADTDFLYAVMEYAEEDLSQILPERALTTSEIRDMLEPVLDALAFVHGERLVHSHVKPSNILATGDHLKLSTDTLFPSGESRTTWGASDVYTAPECATGILSPASDVWSLGVTLLEGLTQHPPEWQPASSTDPHVPHTLPQPFQDIARHTLNRDPKLRWNIAQIRASLNPAAVAAAAAQSVSPLAVPLSPIPAIPAAKLETPKPAKPAAKMPSPQPPLESLPKQSIVLPNYIVPLAVGLLLIVAIIALPRILGHRADTSSSASTAPASSPAEPKPAEKPARPATSRSTKPGAAPATGNAAKAPVEKKPAQQVSQAPTVSPAPAKLRTETFPSAEPPKGSASSSGRGEVLDQVLPEASQGALATIQGTVRVSVRLHVDAAGNVSAAELENPGPSHYFADLALQAARRWEFTSPEVGGRSVPSEWLVRFEFSPSGVKALPTQTSP